MGSLASRGVVLAFVALACAACAEPVKEPVGLAEEPAKWDARAFCRSTTCSVPKGWPKGEACQPPRWSEECAGLGKWNVPLWWRTSCVGYSLDERASKNIPYDVALGAVQAGFRAWTTRTCAGGHVSIDARDLGPVACRRTVYDREGPNQNVIVFQDEKWPHAKKSAADLNPIALTTVTFDTSTGEIFDADIELNTAEFKIVHDRPPAIGESDLYSVLTHEIGHFFGVAHSADRASVMFSDDDGSAKKRSLTVSDVAAICSIYPADGTRTVSALVTPTGKVTAGACDPTPRRGVARQCD